MSKELEALKRITLKDFILNDESSLNDIKLIEKALKEYESYRGFLHNVEKGIVTYTPRDIWEEERKKLKALEIIKKKKVHVSFIYQTKSYIEYNGLIDNIENAFGIKGAKKLTQEEYDLIKEVLL